MREFGVVDILLLTLDKCCHVVKGTWNGQTLKGRNLYLKTTKKWKMLFCISLLFLLLWSFGRPTDEVTGRQVLGKASIFSRNSIHNTTRSPSEF